MAGLDMVKRRDDKVDGRRGLERFAGALVYIFGISFPDVNKTLQKFGHAAVVHFVVQEFTHFMAWSLISRLTDEKASALQQNQKLRQELELVKKAISKTNAGGFSMLFVVLIGFIGVLVGYLIKKT
ncbi:hypothetical protein FXO37_18743 [Capsicum annuum]|nr:hypothetical protein FXO37_18743 [Capsicum annuum]